MSIGRTPQLKSGKTSRYQVTSMTKTSRGRKRNIHDIMAYQVKFIE